MIEAGKIAAGLKVKTIIEYKGRKYYPDLTTVGTWKTDVCRVCDLRDICDMELMNLCNVLDCIDDRADGHHDIVFKEFKKDQL